MINSGTHRGRPIARTHEPLLERERVAGIHHQGVGRRRRPARAHGATQARRVGTAQADEPALARCCPQREGQYETPQEKIVDE
jgi:hypothetical protein